VKSTGSEGWSVGIIWTVAALLQKRGFSATLTDDLTIRTPLLIDRKWI
jgi:hypothetical protein